MHDETGALVQQASRGDGVALDRLLEQFLPDLASFLRVRVAPRLLAKESCDDLVQSVCREVLQDLDQIEYRGERAFRQWLFLAAERKIKDRDKYWRRQARDTAREDVAVEVDAAAAPGASDATPSRQAIHNEEQAALERALQSLPEDHRTVITLSRYLGMSHAEIAAELGRSEGAVRVLLHRAIAKLGVLLDAGGGE